MAEEDGNFVYGCRRRCTLHASDRASPHVPIVPKNARLHSLVKHKQQQQMQEYLESRRKTEMPFRK